VGRHCDYFLGDFFDQSVERAAAYKSHRLLNYTPRYEQDILQCGAGRAAAYNIYLRGA
jgi:hypothetical protein